MAEDGTGRKSGVSQIGLTLFKSVHTMNLSERQAALSIDSDGVALKGDGIESNDAGQNRKNSSVRTLLSVDVGDENEAEEEKEVSKEEVSEDDAQNPTVSRMV